MDDKPFGVRYTAFNAKGQLMTYQKFFRTEAALEKHLDKVQESGNLREVIAYSDEA